MVNWLQLQVMHTGTIANCRVEWGADHGDVIVLAWLDQTFDRVKMGEAGNSRERPLFSSVSIYKNS